VACLFHGEERLSVLFADLVDGSEGAGAERLTDSVVRDETSGWLVLIGRVNIAPDLFDHVALTYTGGLALW